MPTRVDALIRRLEEARHLRPGARNAESLLRAARGAKLADAASLIRFHEAVLFLRAYPHNRRVRELADRLLGSIGRRVAQLAEADEDLSAFDALEVGGIAGTTVGTDFSFDISRFLAARFPGRVRIDWAAGVEEDRMRASFPEFLPMLEEEGLADANVPYLAWLEAAAGRRKDDLAWLLRRYERLPYPEGDRADRFDSLGLPVSWDLGESRASRTKMRRPGPAPFYHDGPFLARRDVSLEAVFAAPRLALRKLPRKEGERFCDMVREATAARYREFYTFTYADPGSVIAARPGRGVELFLVGIQRGRRLPLRSAYGGFVVKNGVPIGYIEGLAFLERLEIGFNMYYTFREGESAWIYAQVLKLHRDALGVTAFSIDPYQLGFENDEAIESGAFWFYRKLGFRPTDPSVRRLTEREESRIAARPGYRSPPATLRRLVTHNLLYEVPGTESGDWDSFHIRNLGLAVNRRMARDFGGDPTRLRAAAEARVVRALGLGTRSLSVGERVAFREFALALDLVPDLSRWARGEREGVVEILRAKAGPTERRYLRLMQGHPRLRAALIRAGSAPRRSAR